MLNQWKVDGAYENLIGWLKTYVARALTLMG